MNVVYLSTCRECPLNSRLRSDATFATNACAHRRRAARRKHENPVHYNLPQAMALVQQIHLVQAYLVGMSCDSFLPHDKMNERLRTEYGADISVQLAYDGLVIYVNTNTE